MRKQAAHRSGALKQRILFLAIALLLLYGILPQLSGLGNSFGVLGGANPILVLAGVLVFSGVFMVGTAIYLLLAAKRLSLFRTLGAQIAAGMTGKLLPAGIGTIGLMVQYLRMSGHSTAQAIGVVGVNNVLGMMGHGILLLVVVMLLRPEVPPLAWDIPGVSVVIGTVVTLALIVILLVRRTLWRRMLNGLREIRGQLAAYRKRPAALGAALFLTMLLTAFYSSTLYFSAHALGYELSLEMVFLVFSLGTLIGTATPTPGGAIGAEAGLTAGFVAYGLALTDGLAIALLYRLITYWLPLVPGTIAFIAIRRYLKL